MKNETGRFSCHVRCATQPVCGTAEGSSVIRLFGVGPEEHARNIASGVDSRSYCKPEREDDEFLPYEAVDDRPYSYELMTPEEREIEDRIPF